MTAGINLGKEDYEQYKYLLMATRNGLVKKTRLDAYANVRDPHDMLYFLGSCWRCVLMPRLAKGFSHSYCAIADAITGKLVWGRECSAISPDMDTLRKGLAK